MSKTKLLGLATAMLLLISGDAFAHGYIEFPACRAKVGAPNNVGNAQYEPQSLEAPKGYPQGGPADGKIASAGGCFGGILDEQTATRWIKHDIKQGPMQISWHFTARHRTTKWHYYITKQGWNPNQPLKRSDFQLVETFNYAGVLPPERITHTINIPKTHNGYHVILGVWDIYDTSNAFYHVVDVNIAGNGGGTVDTQAPTVPGKPTTSNIGTTSATLSFTGSTDNVGVAGYEAVVVNTGKSLLRASANGADPKSRSAITQHLSGLTSNTEYTVGVRAYDAAGNYSAISTTTKFKTLPEVAVDNQPPTKVTNLHDMGRTMTSIDLMWTESNDNVGVTEYKVFNAKTNQQIASTVATRYLHNGLTPNTEYSYYVIAYDAAGNASPRSDVYTIKTNANNNGTDTQAPTVPGKPTVASIETRSAEVSFTGSTDNVAVDAYEVIDTQTSTVLAIISETSVNSKLRSSLVKGALIGLMPNKSYTIAVRAYDAAKNRSSFSASTTFTTKTEQGGGIPSGNEYDPNKIYDKPKTVVTYEGNTYESQWYINKNQYPKLTDRTGASTGWKLIAGSALENSEWNKNTTYNTGDEVTYKGKKYVAQYWTKGNEPGKDQYGPWKQK